MADRLRAPTARPDPGRRTATRIASKKGRVIEESVMELLVESEGQRRSA
jgi:hypothetical protein